MLKSAENVIKILFLLKENDDIELGLNEISRISGINKSTVHQILKTLQEYSLVEQNLVTSKYKLGIGILQLSGSVLKHLDLRNASRPIMKKLSEKHKHTVTLAVRNGKNLTFIERTDGMDNVRFFCDIGKVTPFNGGAAAKAFLAYLPESEINEIINDLNQNKDKFTQKTMDTIQLAEDLINIRKRGYSISDEEVDIGVKAFGVPIFSYRGEVIGSMAVAGLKQIMEKENEKLLTDDMLSASKEISGKMGFSISKTE